MTLFKFPKSIVPQHSFSHPPNPVEPEKFQEIARGDTSTSGVLVLLDAEREHAACPPNFAYGLATRSQALKLRFPVVIVCAVCEYESWFLYNIPALIPKYLLPGSTYDKDPEKECGAKGWLAQHTYTGSYKPTINQAKMTAEIDVLETTAKSRSFRRLADAVGELIEAIDSGKLIVTPIPA